MCYIECPCHKCKSRSAECHGLCEAYAEFKRENDLLSRKLKRERERDDWARRV